MEALWASELVPRVGREQLSGSELRDIRHELDGIMERLDRLDAVPQRFLELEERIDLTERVTRDSTSRRLESSG